MAPNILASEDHQFDEFHMQTSAATKPIMDPHQFLTTDTIVVLPEMKSSLLEPSRDGEDKHEEDERNDQEVLASKSAEDDRETSSTGDEAKESSFDMADHLSSGLFEDEEKSNERPSSLFADEPIFGKMESFASNLVGSRNFQFPKINTNFEKKMPSSSSMTSPAASFFSNMRSPSRNNQRASPTSGLLSLSLSGSFEDVELQPSGLQQSGLQQSDLQQAKLSGDELEETEESETEESENDSAQEGNEMRVKSSPLPPQTLTEQLEKGWEDLKGDVQKFASSSSSIGTNSTSGSSWFNQSMSSFSQSMGSNGTAFSSFSKKSEDTWKSIKREVKDIIREENNFKDAYMKSFGTQVSRQDGDEMFEHFPGGEVWETLPEKEMYLNAI